MFVVFTSAAYNHHKLSVPSAFSVLSPFKSYHHHLFTRLCHGIVLYSPSESSET